MSAGALRTWVPAAVALLVALGAGSVIVGAPAGLPTATDVVFNAAADDSRTEPEVLIQRGWGEGRLLVAGFAGPGEGRRLAIAFAIDHGRGWRLGGYTVQQAERDDVRVASLLVAGSDGGAGQPPWTAAYGELSDDRITRVQVVWGDETTTDAELRGRAYLAVHSGREMVEVVRYLAEDGSEIAVVPV